MTVINLIDLVIDRLAGGDAPQDIKGKFHPEIVRKHISIIYNYLINSVVYPQAKKNSNWGYLDPYVTTFSGVEVLENTDRNEKYSIIPSSYIPLPQNRGIRTICPLQGQDQPFWYRSNNSISLYSNLDIDAVDPRTRYYLEGNKVYYSYHIGNIESVLMKLITPFDSKDDDEEIVIPMGYDKLILDMVIESLKGGNMEKFTNDNNSNTK